MGKTTKTKTAKQKPAKKKSSKKPVITTIQIQQYIAKPVSQKLTFYKFIDDAVKHKTKLHIKAPTGAGKNVLAKYYIKDKKLDVIYVVPQISIGTQFKERLALIGITALEYNYDVRKKGSINWPSGRKVVMSTLDSLQYLVKESWFKKQTLIFIDETHTALQTFREGFSPSISLIKKGYAVVGFSATPSAFVNKHILDFDVEVVVTHNNPKQLKIQPLYVHKHLNDLVANHCVDCAAGGLVIVFVNEKRQMTAIKDKILELDNRLKVEIFNADTKTKTPYWDKLMKDEVIDPKINVVLLNAVANAGVNIKNPDSEISAVIIVGKFDPLGFLQYLGRPRNYTKEIAFMFNADGNKPQPFKLATIQKAQVHAKIIREQNEKALADGIEFFNCKTKSSDIDISEDKLLIAHEHYRQCMADLRGDELWELIDKEKGITNISFEPQVDVSEAQFQALSKQYRDKRNQDLAEFIADSHSYAYVLNLFIKWSDTSWVTVENRIRARPYYKSFIDQIKGKYLKNNYQKQILLDKIALIKKANKSIQNIKTAIYIAQTSWDNTGNYSAIEAKEKAEFVLKGNSSAIRDYTKACQIYTPGHKILVEQDLIHIHEHFQDIILAKRNFLDTNEIKDEINIGAYSNFDKQLLADIFKVMFKTTRTDHNTKYLIKEVHLYLKDYILNSKWKSQYTIMKAKAGMKATATPKPRSITKPKAIGYPKAKAKTKLKPKK